MNQSEFLSKLSAILERNQVADAAEIVEEYEQHFAFKLADGYAEEEIAARLGNPEQLAMQYGRDSSPASHHNGLITKIVMGIADIFVGLFYLLLTVCGAAIVAAGISFAAVGICLILGARPFLLIPVMPRVCGVILGCSLAALSVLIAVGDLCYWAQFKQLLKAFGRFQHNRISAATGMPVLPPLPTYCQFAPKTKHCLRGLVLISLMVFAVLFVLDFILCVLSAGSFSFWHVWGWFQ